MMGIREAWAVRLIKRQNDRKKEFPEDIDRELNLITTNHILLLVCFFLMLIVNSLPIKEPWGVGVRNGMWGKGER